MDTIMTAAVPLAEMRHVATGAARAKGLTPEEAEDVTQDVLERWLRAGPLRNPVAWASVVARHRALSLLRRRKTAERFMPALVPPPPADTAETALDALARSDLRDAVRRLPERQREVTAMRLAGWDEARICAATGLTRGTVKSHAARAKANLRKELEPRVIADGRQDVTLTGSRKGDTWTR